MRHYPALQIAARLTRRHHPSSARLIDGHFSERDHSPVRFHRRTMRPRIARKSRGTMRQWSPQSHSAGNTVEYRAHPGTQQFERL